MFWTFLIIFIITVLVPAIALFITLIWVARRRFLRQVIREVEPILELACQQIFIDGKVIMEADIVGLPEPVQRWLRYSGVVGRPKLYFARTRQSGRFRQAANRPWMKADVTQYTLVNPPSRVWIADMRMPANLPVLGRDLYQNEHGNMLIKPLAMFRYEDAKSTEIDQGSAAVFFNDMMFIPQIALENYIRWEPIDDMRARATFADGEIQVTADFEFNELGELKNMIAKRYGKFDDEFRLERWSTPVLEYQEVYGFRIPKRVDVIWHLEEGDLCYFEATLDEVEFNKAVLYS